AQRRQFNSLFTDIAAAEKIDHRLLDFRISHHVFVARIADGDMNATLEVPSDFVRLEWRATAVQCPAEEQSRYAGMNRGPVFISEVRIPEDVAHIQKVHH